MSNISHFLPNSSLFGQQPTLTSDEMSRVEPIWQNLPFHFKQDVVSSLDYKSRCHLRVCSKDDKAVVDFRPAKIEFLGLKLTEPIFDSFYKETPASITIRDKNVSTSKLFTEDDAIEQVLKIFSNGVKLEVTTLNIHVWNYDRGGRMFKFFKKFLVESNSRNIILNVRHLNLPTTFMDKKQYVSFVKTFNVDLLETMRLYRSTACQLKALAETEQWKKVKEIKFTTIYEIEADWVLHVEKLDIQAKNLNGETSRALIQNFLTKNFQRGSFMSIVTNYPIPNDLLQQLPVEKLINESIRFESLTNAPIKTRFQNPLHTQKIRMEDRNSVLLIIICEACFAAIVCAENNFEQDLIKFIQD